LTQENSKRIAESTMPLEVLHKKRGAVTNIKKQQESQETSKKIRGKQRHNATIEQNMAR